MVPSDILAGILLLREKQKASRSIEAAKSFDYLSGVSITESTKFFSLGVKENLDFYNDLIYFYDYAAASYGWPLYMYRSKFACFKLLPNIKNCFKTSKGCNLRNISNLFERIRRDNKTTNDHQSDTRVEDVEECIENDNCCMCYYDAVLRQLPSLAMGVTDKPDEFFMFDEKNHKQKHIKIIHANFSSDIGKPCYFVALDFWKRKLVISIRGTESFRDWITDMQWRAIPMPNVERELEWHGHEGIVKSAMYLKQELESKKIIEKARNYDLVFSFIFLKNYYFKCLIFFILE